MIKISNIYECEIYIWRTWNSTTDVKGGKHMRSVIIDDEQLILERFTRLLSKIEDIEIVRTYTNANEAIATIEQDKPDVVFLDIEMPGLNGIDVAEILKEKTP